MCVCIYVWVFCVCACFCVHLHGLLPLVYSVTAHLAKEPKAKKGTGVNWRGDKVGYWRVGLCHTITFFWPFVLLTDTNCSHAERLLRHYTRLKKKTLEEKVVRHMMHICLFLRALFACGCLCVCICVWGLAPVLYLVAAHPLHPLLPPCTRLRCAGNLECAIRSRHTGKQRRTDPLTQQHPQQPTNHPPPPSPTSLPTMPFLITRLGSDLWPPGQMADVFLLVEGERRMSVFSQWSLAQGKSRVNEGLSVKSVLQ